MATDDDSLIRQVKLALLKAIGVMGTTPMKIGSTCLSAAGVAAAVLTHYHVPYEVVCGFTTTEGMAQAMTHVWLNTPGRGITDISFKTVDKELPLLGQYFSVTEGATFKLKYHAGKEPPPGFAVLPDTTPLHILQYYSSNFDLYFAQGTDNLRATRDAVLAQALDGKRTLTIPRSAVAPAAQEIAGNAVSH